MLIEARQLSKQYGAVRALDEVTIEVGAGEIVCLLGPNGAGKTTLLNVLLGFVSPTSGRAFVNGIDVVADPRRARRALAYVPELVTLYPHLSGLENLRFFAALSGHREHSSADLERMLADVGLPTGHASRRVGVYSKGMRQKVGIAIALAKRASVLLLDEPTSGLDPASASELSALITGLADRGCAVLMTTHDLFRARTSGGRIGIMRQGRLSTSLDSRSVDLSSLEQIYLQHV
jgi:ABC-2 type transport system ATP-binding protein